MPPTTPKFAGAVAGRHLGRKPATDAMKKRCLPFRNFVNLEAAHIPASCDYFTKATKALGQMMGNDAQGDCVAVTIAKKVGLDTANVPGGKEVVATTEEVLRFYHEVGGPADNGLYIPEALDYAMTKGIQIGAKRHQIEGYVSVDHTDPQLFRAACYYFGGAHLGVNLTNDWYQHAESTDVWVPNSSPIVGGHSVPVTGYTADKLKIATWARQPQMSVAALTDRRFVDECYAVLGKDWSNAAGIDTNGFNVSALREALNTIRNGGVPVIPPDPNPPTPPAPPVPDNGGTLLDTTGTLTLHGQTFAVSVVMSLVNNSPAPAQVNLWSLLTDITALNSAVMYRDWAGAAAALVRILGDLGITMTAAQVEAVVKRLSTSAIVFHHGGTSAVLAYEVGQAVKADESEQN